MSSRGQSTIIAVAIVGCLATTSIEGQEPVPVRMGDPCPETVPIERLPFWCQISPLELAAELRSDLNLMGYVARTLVQFWRPHPQAELDALADTLVAIGVDYGRRADMESRRVKNMVVNNLSAAMRWSTPPYASGEAYQGGGERFIALAHGLLPDEELTSLRPVVGSILGYLMQIPDRDEGLRHLREFAMSRNFQAAYVAFDILRGEAGAAGSEILRELYLGDLVRQPFTKERLEDLASARGWRR